MKVNSVCLAMLTLATALALMTLRCVAATKPPVPLWTRALAWRDSKPAHEEITDARIAEATPEAIFVERGTGSLAALDVRTGRELWQLNRESEMSRTYANLESTTSVYANRNPDVISWKLLGTARRAGMESVAVLMPRIWYQHRNMDNVLRGKTVYHLLGVGAGSGKVVWVDNSDRFEIPTATVTVVNGVLAFLRSPPDSSPLEYWDAATGQQLGRRMERQEEGRLAAATREQTQRQIGHILAVNPGTSRLACTPDVAAPAPWLFRVANGRLEPIQAVHIGQYSYALFVQQDRLITYVDTDNDSPGGSTFPKYLQASDLQGRTVWKFPAVLQEHDYNIGAQSPDTIQQAIAVWDTPLCLALDNRCIFGIRVNDGATVWKRARSPYYLEQRGVWKQGCFGFTSKYWTAEAAAKPDGDRADKATVSYVSAQSGKARVALTLPFVLQVFVGGDTLYVQTAPNVFRAYNIPTLMARQPAPKSPYNPARAGKTGRKQ